MSTFPISYAVPHAEDPPEQKNGIPTAAGLNNMFLELLVVQLKNQNPLKPMDPAQFVGQLAQFSELSEVASIRELLQKAFPGITDGSDSKNGSAGDSSASGDSRSAAGSRTSGPIDVSSTVPGTTVRDHVSPAHALSAIYNKLQGGF